MTIHIEESHYIATVGRDFMERTDTLADNRLRTRQPIRRWHGRRCLRVGGRQTRCTHSDRRWSHRGNGRGFAHLELADTNCQTTRA